jgi:ribosomal protein L7Ae-like RNA K-turn-binding protein
MKGIEKTLSALGMCAGARKLICGTPQVCEALRGAHKPYLVLAPSDNSENTAKRLRDRCAYYHVELVILDTDADRLSAAIGKQGRIAAVAVTDPHLYRLVAGTLRVEEHNV